MTANDQDLLRQFTRDHAQDAFTALVQRHVNLVYSAALRQVRSPQLAEEVAQSVFTDLARRAAGLKPTILTAWLYQVTRRTAIDVVRRESRRQARERLAAEMTAMNASSSDWSHIEPLLDDAMLQRYAIVPASSIPNMKMGGDWLITVKNPVDEEFDSYWALGERRFGSSNHQGSKEASILGPPSKPSPTPTTARNPTTHRTSSPTSPPPNKKPPTKN